MYQTDALKAVGNSRFFFLIKVIITKNVCGRRKNIAMIHDMHRLSIMRTNTEN